MEIGVNVRGDGNGGVAHSLLKQLEICACPARRRRLAMAEIVDAKGGPSYLHDRLAPPP
jgi:hypothetical protein